MQVSIRRVLMMLRSVNRMRQAEASGTDPAVEDRKNLDSCHFVKLSRLVVGSVPKGADGRLAVFI